LFKNDSNIEYIEEDVEIKIDPVPTTPGPVEVDYDVYYFKAPDDPLFPKQWGLANNGTNSSSTSFEGKEGEDINALKAWSNFKLKKSIKIAVIDTGVEYNHPDLKENIMVNLKELNGEDGVDDDDNGFVDDVYGYDFSGATDNDPMDGNGHGTHCAGIIAASHNDIGVSGVVSKAQILPVQFLTASGRGSYAGAVKAIDYAIKRGVDIMSNSWGGGSNSRTVKLAVNRAEKAGILFVAAAGNSYNNSDEKPLYPAAFDNKNIVSVGSYQGDGNKSGFSNYGQKSVDVFAPGSKIYSTYKGKTYKSLSGTSMATPMVSGIAAYLLSVNPKLTVKKLKERLINTSVKTDALKDLSVSNGRVDTFRALKNLTNN
jgi:subtilisin family serine protease